MHHLSDMIDQAACACTSLRKASRAVTRLYDDMLRETGMSTIQFSILRTIARAETLPLMALADRLVMDRTTLYRALGPLEQRGWLAIADSDGRAKHVALTQAGTQSMTAATANWQAAQTALLGTIGMPAWTTLENALKALTAAAQDHTP